MRAVQYLVRYICDRCGSTSPTTMHEREDWTKPEGWEWIHIDGIGQIYCSRCIALPLGELLPDRTPATRIIVGPVSARDL